MLVDSWEDKKVDCQCGATLAVSGQSDCNRAICPKCENESSIPTRSSSVVTPSQGSAQELSTFSVVYVAHLNEVRSPILDERCQVLSDVDAEFRSRFPNVLNKKPSAIVDKPSNHVTLNYKTAYTSSSLFDQMKAFLASAFRPYESDT